MTMSLSVNAVLQNPTPFESRWRLAVVGVLLLTDGEFLIYQEAEFGPDESTFLTIDDPLAVEKLREALPEPRPDGWWYFGEGMVEAWTRLDPGGWVLHEVVTVWLDEVGGERGTAVKIRPHPWGWDQFL